MDTHPAGDGRLPASQTALLYDAECAFCRAQVRLGAPLLGRALALLPLQGSLADFPAVDGARARRAVALAEADGTVRYGAGAISRALEIAGWPLSARLYRVPLLRRVADRAYAWVARNRARLSGERVACDEAACRVHHHGGDA